MIKYVIFDMDGTLLDTEKIYYETWCNVAERWGFPPMKIDEYVARISGRNRESNLRTLREYYGKGFFAEKYMKERFELYDASIKRYLPIKEGSRELLTYLREKGIKTALATSTSFERAAFCMKKAELYDLLDVIVTGDMVEKGKPSPDIFLKTCEALCADASETAVVEDSKSGIVAAYNAKMKPVMVVDMYSPDDELKKLCCGVYDTLFDVIELIEKENK